MVRLIADIAYALYSEQNVAADCEITVLSKIALELERGIQGTSTLRCYGTMFHLEFYIEHQKRENAATDRHSDGEHSATGAAE